VNDKRCEVHGLRQEYLSSVIDAIHFFEDGYTIRTVKVLPGHNVVRTTMIYTHVLNRGGKGVKSPVDDL